MLNEHMVDQQLKQKYDIFLSHTFDDKDLILGLASTIEGFGYSVYIDWRDDPLLDRRNVTAATAALLRERMKASACLFYATTANADNSRWMPWELGFKDGHNSRTAILPIAKHSTEDYAGQEYLGIYPYVADGTLKGKNILWIHRSPNCYVTLNGWVEGKNPINH